ncbi:MAG: cyclic nucleotide-binding domain-containing protein, partial [Nitrospinota bacterium]
SEVEIFLTSKVRGNSSISTLSPGDIFGEMSLITREKRSANSKSSNVPLLLLEISKDVLKSNLMLQAKIYKFFARTLADRLKAKNDEVSILNSKISRLTD